jgi:hypothetical protein
MLFCFVNHNQIRYKNSHFVLYIATKYNFIFFFIIVLE